MLNPIEITIDESVFSAPRVGCSINELKKYAEDLMKLGELLKKGTINVYMTKDALYSLSTKKDYSYEVLQSIFDKADECKYSAREIMNVVKHTREHISCFEKNFKIFDVDVNGDIKTNPRIEDIVLSKKRRSELKKCAIMIAILLNCSDEKDLGHVLIIKCKSRKSRMGIEAEICYVNSNNQKVKDLPHSPNTFKASIPFFCDLSQVMIILKAISLLGAGIDEQAKSDVYDALFRKTG